MDRQIGRRDFMLGAAAAAAGGVAPRLAQAQQPLAGQLLRISTWGGSWRDAAAELVGSQLEQRGAKIEYNTGEARAQLAKLISARGREPLFDVLELDDSTRSAVEEGKFLAPLDYSRLPNTGDL